MGKLSKGMFVNYLWNVFKGGYCRR